RTAARQPLDAGAGGRAGLLRSTDRSEEPDVDSVAEFWGNQQRPADGVGKMGDSARPPADGPRVRQPRLATLLRRGDRRHVGQFRPPRRSADAPGTTRLAGFGIREGRLEHEGAAPADHSVERLSTIEYRVR